MVLEAYLQYNSGRLEDISAVTGYSINALESLAVSEYPEYILNAISHTVEKDISLVLFEMLNLENPYIAARAASDYSLRMAIQKNALYIFIPHEYRQEQTKFLTDVLLEKGIFETDVGRWGKFNIIGKMIYEGFLTSLPKSEEFKQVQDNLLNYGVKAHDKSGSLLYLPSKI